MPTSVTASAIRAPQRPAPRPERHAIPHQVSLALLTLVCEFPTLICEISQKKYCFAISPASTA
jgi:hypothetical protein